MALNIAFVGNLFSVAQLLQQFTCSVDNGQHEAIQCCPFWIKGSAQGLSVTKTGGADVRVSLKSEWWGCRTFINTKNDSFMNYMLSQQLRIFVAQIVPHLHHCQVGSVMENLPWSLTFQLWTHNIKNYSAFIREIWWISFQKTHKWLYCGWSLGLRQPWWPWWMTCAGMNRGVHPC